MIFFQDALSVNANLNYIIIIVIKDMPYDKDMQIHEWEIQSQLHICTKSRSQLNGDTAMEGTRFLHCVFDGPGVGTRVVAFDHTAGPRIH